MSMTAERSAKGRSTIYLLSFLLAVVILGFCLLTVNSQFFSTQAKKLEVRKKNQENRLLISEWVINDLERIKGTFFRMATAILPESQELCRWELMETVTEIMELLNVIEKGGIARREMKLNLAEISSLQNSVKYQPIGHQIYNLEILNLRPMLLELEDKTTELASMLKLRYTFSSTDKEIEHVKQISKIKKFIRDFSPFFNRISENANLLLYNSNRRLTEINQFSRQRFLLYQKLKNIILASVVSLVILISVLLVRRVIFINHRLLDEIKTRLELENSLRRQRDTLEDTVQERTRELKEDIRVRKAVEADLRRTSQELEAIFSNSRIGIILLKNGRSIAQCNQRAAEIFGYDSVSEMQGITTRNLHLSLEDFEDFGRLYYDNLVQGELLQIEYQLKKKSGEAFWCMLSGKALDPAPSPDLNVGVLWVVDDITAQKEAAGEREKLIKELEKALEQVKTLAGIVPICMYCKKIRDDQGYWNQLEKFICEHSEAEFSHGVCPECYEKMIAEFNHDIKHLKEEGA